MVSEGMRTGSVAVATGGVADRADRGDEGDAGVDGVDGDGGTDTDAGDGTTGAGSDAAWRGESVKHRITNQHPPIATTHSIHP